MESAEAPCIERVYFGGRTGAVTAVPEAEWVPRFLGGLETQLLAVLYQMGPGGAHRSDLLVIRCCSGKVAVHEEGKGLASPTLF